MKTTKASKSIDPNFLTSAEVAALRRKVLKDHLYMTKLLGRRTVVNADGQKKLLKCGELHEHFETLRNEFRPQKVRVLFVGESRPRNLTFFYAGDSNLAKYTREAFNKAFNLGFETPDDFLPWFRDNAFYLDDLCPEPVNQLGPQARRTTCREYIASLANRLDEYAPEFIIVTPKKIRGYVTEAVNHSTLKELEQWNLPFPACGHQNQYVGQLAAKLSETFPELVVPPIR